MAGTIFYLVVDIHLFFQALWTTLPEKNRVEWGKKARRAEKQLQAAADKDIQMENKRIAELKRTETQLSRTQTTKYSLVDIAAHFKLLSDSFGRAAEMMSDYRVRFFQISVYFGL